MITLHMPVMLFFFLPQLFINNTLIFFFKLASFTFCIYMGQLLVLVVLEDLKGEKEK